MQTTQTTAKNTPEEQLEIIKAYLEGKKVRNVGSYDSRMKFTEKDNGEFDKESLSDATFDFYTCKYEIVQQDPYLHLREGIRAGKVLWIKEMYGDPACKADDQFPERDFGFQPEDYELRDPELEEKFIIAINYGEDLIPGWTVAKAPYSQQELYNLMSNGVEYQKLQSVFVPKN